ncbi:MAG: acyl-CoA dehydrogenase family protein [Chloroflexota bacterium]|nr:acyl-CoA dehydrogenase family protein [Chloroflexota bacterium]
MNLDFTEEQEMLRTMARDFIEKECPKTKVKELEEDPKGYSPETWSKMAELGWMGLIIPEEYGGTNGTFMDLVILLEEIGRGCLPGPFFSTVVLGALPIMAAGNQEQKQELLPKIAKGEIITALALTEPSASYNADAIETKAIPQGDDYIINGTKLFVHDAHVANYLICAARTHLLARAEDSITLFLVSIDTPGLKIVPLPTIADDKQNEVVFENVRVPKKNILGTVNQGWCIIQRLLEQAALAKCAEMVGGADWTVETCIAYAKERVQYDRPIGAFGAIQTYLAEMWTEVGMAKRLLYYTAWLEETGRPSSTEISMTKAWVSKTYTHWSRMGVQIHGGIGTTRDHDMGLYYRRARQANVLFGTPDMHTELVAQQIGL